GGGAEAPGLRRPRRAAGDERGQAAPPPHLRPGEPSAAVPLPGGARVAGAGVVTAVTDRGRRVAVTGLGIVSAAGADSAAFCRAIQEGRSASEAALVREEDLGGRPGPRDKVFRLAVQAAAEAAAGAGLGKGPFPAGSGLVVATSLGGMLKAQSWHEALLQ